MHACTHASCHWHLWDPLTAAAAVPLTPDSSLCACTYTSTPGPAAMGSARAPAICPVSGAAKTSSRPPGAKPPQPPPPHPLRPASHMHALFNLEVSSISYHRDASNTASPPSTTLASNPKLTPKLKLKHTHSAQPNNKHMRTLVQPCATRL